MLAKRIAFKCALGLLLVGSGVWGQEAQNDVAVGPTTNYTPAAIAPGSPDGTMVLSAHETVSLYSGALSFAVPLYRVGGRGGAGYTMMLPLGTRWHIENHPNSPPMPNNYLPIGATYPYDNVWPTKSTVNRYSPGKVLRRDSIDPTITPSVYNCGNGNVQEANTYYQSATLTKIVWIEGDGTEHLFLDTANGAQSGQPIPVGGPNPQYSCLTDPLYGGPSRGRVFEATDGSGATFVADLDLNGMGIYDAITKAARLGLPKQPNLNPAVGDGHGLAGWLLFKDGSRYQTDTNGNVEKIVDRLGNTTTLSTDSMTYLNITDSLGRTINVTYGNLEPGTGPVYDTIVYPAAGGGGGTHTITITYNQFYFNNGTMNVSYLSSGNTVSTYGALFPFSGGSSSSSFNPLVVTAVTLPDLSYYSFLYNAYGEITQATLPSQGVYQYDYPAVAALTQGSFCNGPFCAVQYSQDDAVTGGTNEIALTRRLLARRVYSSGGTLEGQHCYSATFATGTSPVEATVTVNHYGSDANPGNCTSGTLLSSETHAFYGFGPGDMTPPSMWYASTLNGNENSAQWMDNGATRRATNSAYQADSNGQNAEPCQTSTTLDGTSTSGTYLLYDSYFNVTDAYEYDFGAAVAGTTCPGGAPAGWLRRKHSTYLTDGHDGLASPPSGPNSNHMRSLIAEADVYSPAAGGTMVAKTMYGYDASAPSPETSPTGYAAPTYANSTFLGNVTSKTTFPVLTGGGLTTTYTYDNLGNVLTITEPKGAGYTTTISYSDTGCSVKPAGNLYGFADTVTDAIGQKYSLQWDCYIGKQTQYKDINSVITNYSYLNRSTPDPFDRLTQVQRAVGVTNNVETHTAFSYPSLTQVVTKQDQNSKDDGAVITTSYYDGLLRKIATERSLSSSCVISVKQTYDGKGRPYQISLPYRTGPLSGGTCSGAEAEHFATTAYDGADRVMSVTTDDGSKTMTTYTGNVATVTDPFSAARATTTDGLGRLKQVVEDPAGKDYTTSYNYDLLDDLVSVTQGSLTRTFTYDAMKRLVTAQNPENGTICYGMVSGSTCTENYDANGNLLSKTDNKQITTSYTYDLLNRLTQKQYSDMATATVNMNYAESGSGNCTYNAGRLTSVNSVALNSLPAISESMSYDALGRVCSSSEAVGSVNPGSFSYGYNLASGLSSEIYPSQRTIMTSYDVLNRPIGVNGTATTYANTTGTYYASNGALAQLQLGTSSAPLATEGFTYDSVRQQPTAISVANGAGSSLLALSYGYCLAGDCTKNNGNVQTAGIAVTGMLSVTQNFVYDKVNRLTCADEINGASSGNCGSDSSPVWMQSYSYDQWGNRAVSGSYIPNSYATPTGLAQYTNNQWMWTSPSPYDGNGNLVSLPSRSFTYDAENRMTASVQPQMGAISYVYDGNGRRVQKSVTTTAGTTNMTTFIYDGGGQLTAEYGPATGSGTEYLVADALGSTRLVLNAIGGVQERLDYLPFGEELPVGIGGRAAPYSGGVYPSGPDIESEKFTSKERDAETGLDWFESRYYSSAQGRFTSPDEFKGGFLDAFTGQAAFAAGPLPYADIGDPQTLNKYAYVRNNPLRYTDPNGHCVEDLCIGEAILAYTAATAVAGGAIYYAQRLGTAIGDFFSAKRSDREVTPPANPNKPGTRGKEDHQQTANEEADRVNGDREVRIPTPGGKKDTRVADAVGTNPQTGQPEIVQVVRPTKTGGVPKRETDAATDIEKATGIRS